MAVADNDNDGNDINIISDDNKRCDTSKTKGKKEKKIRKEKSTRSNRRNTKLMVSVRTIDAQEDDDDTNEGAMNTGLRVPGDRTNTKKEKARGSNLQKKNSKRYESKRNGLHGGDSDGSDDRTIRKKRKEKSMRKEKRETTTVKTSLKKVKSNSKVCESKKKKNRKKKKVQKGEDQTPPEIILESAIKRVSRLEMKNPTEVVLVKDDSGIGNEYWIETEMKRILGKLRQDGESEEDKYEAEDEFSGSDDSGCFPVVCRSICEIPLFYRSSKNANCGDGDSESLSSSSTSESVVNTSFYSNGCGLRRPPMHVITEALNNLINTLTSDSSTYGGTAVWAKWFTEALGLSEVSYLASTGLVPELGVLLDLPGFRKHETDNSSDQNNACTKTEMGTKPKKKPPMTWDWNSPYKFHRSCLAVRDLLRAVSESRHPVIMIINNLHQADMDTLRLLHFLLTGDQWDQQLFAQPKKIYTDDDKKLSKEHTKAIDEASGRLQNFLLLGTYDGHSKIVSKTLETLEQNFLKKQEFDWKEQQEHFFQQAMGRDLEFEGTFQKQSRFHKICLEPQIEILERMFHEALAGASKDNSEICGESSHVEQDLREFTKIVYKWTNCNASFGLQVLEYLKEEGSISSLPSHNWNIDEARIESRLCETDPIGLMTFRINRLPGVVRFALIITSSIRQTRIGFSTCQLFRLLRSAYSWMTDFPFDSISAFERALATACDLKFMKRIICDRNTNNNRTCLAFSHTIIRDAAYSLFSEQKMKLEIHLRIGTEASALAVSGDLALSSDECSAFKFLAADQLVIAEEILDQDCDSVALLLVETAELCVSKSAFFTAIQYLQIGIELLRRNEGLFTQKNHGTCIRMYLLKARLHSTCDQDKIAIEKSFREIRKNSRNLKDEILLQQVEIGILVGQKRYQEALRKTLRTLDMLGEKLPNVRGLPEITSLQFEELVQLTVSKATPKLFRPSHCTEKKVCDVMSLLANLLEISQLCPSEGYRELATIRMMHRSLTSGFTRQYSTSFAYYGASLMKHLSATGDLSFLREGFRIGKVCEKLARVDDFYGGHSLAVFHFYISHWRRPYRLSLGQVLSIYNNQIESGDYFHINFTVFTYIQYHLTCGHNLTKLDGNLQLFDVLYKNYKMKDDWKIKLPQRFVLNMLGETSSPFLFVGCNLEDQKSQISRMKDGGETDTVNFIYFLMLFTSIFFHHHALSKSCLEEVTEESVLPIWRPWIIFFQCLTDIVFIPYIENPQEKEKFKELVNQKKDRLLDWYNEGAINCSVMIALVNAEFTVADPGNKPLTVLRIQKLYDDAIAVSRKQELKHLEGFCLERASMRFEIASAHGLSAEYMAKAHQCYIEWNATAKAVDIEEKHATKLKFSKREKMVGAGYVRQNSGLQYDPNQVIGGRPSEIKGINIKDAARKVEKVKDMVFGRTRFNSERNVANDIVPLSREPSSRQSKFHSEHDVTKDITPLSRGASSRQSKFLSERDVTKAIRPLSGGASSRQSKFLSERDVTKAIIPLSRGPSSRRSKFHSEGDVTKEAIPLSRGSSSRRSKFHVERDFTKEVIPLSRGPSSRGLEFRSKRDISKEQLSSSRGSSIREKFARMASLTAKSKSETKRSNKLFN